MGAFSFATRGSIQTDSLEQLVRSNPAKVIEALTKRTQKPKALPGDLLLLSKAYLYQGRYYVVDSLMDYVFERYTFKSDSAMYIAFMGIEAENKKILEMYDESLRCLNRILEYTQRRNDTLQLLEIYLKFAEYYRAADNYELALIYLNKVNEVGEQISGGFPPLIKARMLNRKAAVYQEKGVHKDSVELISKAVIQIATEYYNPDLVASSYNELGFLYLNSHNRGVEVCFKNAIAIWDKLGYSNAAHNARLNLARYYLKVGRANEAVKLALVWIKTTREYGWHWDECYWDEILALGYEQLHDYKRALFYLNAAKVGLLQISTTQYKERLAYYSNKLELKSKEEELRKKSSEVEKAKLEITYKSQENQFLFYLISILGIVLIGSLIFLLLTGKQKRMLTKQKEEIGTINEQLQQLVNQKETLLKEVNHRVKNNLSLLAGLMYLKEKELNDDVAIRTLRDMQGRIHTISLIHETLYERDDVVHIDFQGYLERLSSQIMALFPDHRKVSILIHCPNFDPELSLAIPLSMMMNELITNSLKHAFEHVEQPVIEILYDSEHSVVTYRDNGLGYDFGQSTHSLGQKLIKILATQIDARISTGWLKNQLSINIHLIDKANA